MGALNFAAALAVGGALLACWLDVRLEGRRPASATARIGHALMAFLLVRTTTVIAHEIAGVGAHAPTLMVVLFGLVLPGLVYAFLSGLWLMRTLAEVARLSRR